MRVAAAAALGVPEGAVEEVLLVKRSVDARKKSDVHFVATLAVALAGGSTAEEAFLEEATEGRGCRLARGVRVRHYEPPEPLRIPDCARAAQASGFVRPVVVGAGPAGLFCALYLAEAGLRPLLIERGGDVDERARAVEAFAEGAPLDESTNVQFGEGGAGTFSDGKLTTGTKSPHVRHVLQAFVEAGAPPEILWQAKPHIGTDLLPGVVRALREHIVAAGGEVRFHAQLTGLRFADGVLAEIEVTDTRDIRDAWGDAARARVAEGDLHGEHSAACSVGEGRAGEGRTLRREDLAARVAGGGAAGNARASFRAYRVPARQVVLACGHSARDTFELLRDAGLVLERKPFSVGVRIEHAQDFVNRAQYGSAAVHPALGAADYKLAVHLLDGRGVYTFCMCPGGEVVAAASEEGGVCVNGMSRFARDGGNANSALLVDVRPGDLPGGDVLAGVALQRRMERAAYRIAVESGGSPYAAPAQTVGDFLRSARVSSCDSCDGVRPTYPRGVAWCDLHECLPSFVSDAIAQALPLLDRKLRGFADSRAVMTGVETRSSSPVRIVRDEAFQAHMRNGVADDAVCGVSSGVYPAGEGAGYAGGIMSAAVDGLRVAEALARDAVSSIR